MLTKSWSFENSHCWIWDLSKTPSDTVSFLSLFLWLIPDNMNSSESCPELPGAGAPPTTSKSSSSTCTSVPSLSHNRHLFFQLLVSELQSILLAPCFIKIQPRETSGIMGNNRISSGTNENWICVSLGQPDVFKQDDTLLRQIMLMYRLEKRGLDRVDL